MGWYSWHSASSTTFNEVLKELEQKLQNAELDEDGSVKIEMIIKGKNEQKIEFEAKNAQELIEMIKLNSK